MNKETRNWLKEVIDKTEESLDKFERIQREEKRSLATQDDINDIARCISDLQDVIYILQEVVDC